MTAHVFIQLGFTHKSPIAHLALEWALSCMYSLMVFQFLFPLEFFLAESAFKSFQVTVYFHMCHEGVLCHEFVATDLTEKLLVQSMHPKLMVCQINSTYELLGTQFTLKRAHGTARLMPVD